MNGKRDYNGLYSGSTNSLWFILIPCLLGMLQKRPCKISSDNTGLPKHRGQKRCYEWFKTSKSRPCCLSENGGTSKTNNFQKKRWFEVYHMFKHTLVALAVSESGTFKAGSVRRYVQMDNERKIQSKILTTVGMPVASNQRNHQPFGLPDPAFMPGTSQNLSGFSGSETDFQRAKTKTVLQNDQPTGPIVN